MTISDLPARVANGRRIKARRIVMSAKDSIPCLIYRPTVKKTSGEADERSQEVWQGIGEMSIGDETERDYEFIGHAMMSLQDFRGSSLMDNNAIATSEVFAAAALVEPYIDELEGKDRLYTLPEWELKNNDLYALLIDEGFTMWFELVDRMGQTLIPDFGTVYLFNHAHDLNFDEDLDEDFIS